MHFSQNIILFFIKCHKKAIAVRKCVVIDSEVAKIFNVFLMQHSQPIQVTVVSMFVSHMSTEITRVNSAVATKSALIWLNARMCTSV